MLQYIINTTAIWLTGLIVFDLFLRNEANHGYNRFYLVSILLAGALIPLWSWDYDSVIYSAGVSRPIAEQSAEVRQSIVAASESTMPGWEQWLMIIYAVGAGIFMLLLLRDVFNIIGLYSRGTKSKDGTWTIIETGRQQSPFSAFRYVFIGSKDNYSEEELQMILAHEEQHGHLLHFIDVLLMRMANILFWFNPMIYLLEKRLLLVHEYQADKAVANAPSAYGKFLVEQSVLSSAPVLAHSFIRSPLKKRIRMLTRKTTALAKGKQFIIIPVILLSMLCFSQNAFSWAAPQKNGNKVTYRGNVIEFPAPSKPDTTEVVESVTGEHAIVITTREPVPILLNNEKVYNDNELKYGSEGRYIKKSALSDQALKEYLLNNMIKEIRKLEDGMYRMRIKDVVINKDGDIVYFEFDDFFKILESDGVRNKAEPMPDKLQDVFAKKVAVLLNNAPKHEPAVYDGKKVHSVIGTWAFQTPFTIKNKKLVAL